VWDKATEPALNGWTVYIDVNNDNQLEATGPNAEPFTTTGITDLNGDGLITGDEIGYYRFFVTPGTYTIREVPQTGWAQTAPNNAQGEYSVTLANGQSAHNLDFGNTQNFSISGTKYLDANGDGKTTGDAGLGGFTIFVDENGDKSFTAGEPSAVTAADGT